MSLKSLRAYVKKMRAPAYLLETTEQRHFWSYTIPADDEVPTDPKKIEPHGFVFVSYCKQTNRIKIRITQYVKFKKGVGKKQFELTLENNALIGLTKHVGFKVMIDNENNRCALKWVVRERFANSLFN